MTFGFSSCFTDSYSFKYAPAELPEIVKTALDNLGWRYKTLSNNEFQATVSINIWSFGEHVTIKILSTNSIHVESKCISPIQIFDWGKNKKNVEKFFTQIKLLKETSRFAIASKETLPFLNEKGMSPIERVFSENDID